LDSTNERVRRLADLRTLEARVTDDALGPTRRPTTGPANPRERELSTNPGTTNVPASALIFTPADEARDVAQRLDQYTGTLASDTPPAPLTRVLGIAQRSAPEFRTAEENYVLAAIRLLIERHLWGPRFFNDTSLELSTAGEGDGQFQSALNVVNNLRVQKRLPSGGEVEARWVWRAAEQLRQQATGRYRQSSELAVSGRIPLLAGAGPVARESLIQAERELVYEAREFEDFRRSFLVQIAGDFFDLIQAKAEIDNQERQLKSLQEFERAETARFEAGRINEFRRNQASNNVLSARAQLASLRERYILQLDRFKVRLGLSPADPLTAGEIDLELPEPEITPDEASALALEYRLDLQNRRDRLDDSRRAIRNAQNALRPALDASGEVSLPTNPSAREGGLAPDPEALRARAGLELSLPLDREDERLRVRQATILAQRAERDYQRSRDDVAVLARQSVRSIDLSRFQLTLAEQRVEINKRRLVELTLRADTVDTKTRLDAENELLESENARDRARTALRNAVLNYLLQTGQMRVSRTGTLIQPGTAADQNLESVPEIDRDPAAN
jgi:outer membrane protein TolC